MTQTSRSIAHLYLSINAFTPSNPRRPILGSTSEWVRMRVAPWLMHFSIVAEARSITSSTVKVCLTADTRSIARCGLRLVVCSQRPRMQALSRWMWVSTKPEQTRRLPPFISSLAAPPSLGAMAAMRPSLTPISVAG